MALKGPLRQDVPFVPYVTVAAHPSIAECERVAEEFNKEQRVVHDGLAPAADRGP